MKARKKALDVPEGDRFWSVDLGTDEPNLQHFEMPRYTVACGVIALVERVRSAGDLGEFLTMAVRAQCHAALVGASWHNRSAMLDTPLPASALADFSAYGELVIEELTGRYSLAQITLMGEQAESEVRSRLGVVAAAAERGKSFTAAEGKAGAPPVDAAAQSSPEK